MLRLRTSLIITMIAAFSINTYAGGTQPGTDGEDDAKGKKEKKEAEEGTPDNGNDLFGKKKKAWAVGLHAGIPRLLGDIPTKKSLGYGFMVEKALGYSIGLRFHFTAGYMEGSHWQRSSANGLASNLAMNGTIDQNTNYVDARKPAILNFRNSFYLPSLDLVYHLNNISFLRENPRFNLYMYGGLGLMLYDVKMDMLDANGNMYDFFFDGNTAGSQEASYAKLEEIRDFTYESKADANINASQIAGKYYQPIMRLGMGGQYKISERLGVTLEGSYGYTGNDLLDGQRWYGGNIPSDEPDAYGYVGAGITFRLGRTENIYWFSNPLATPYKTILENKRELGKADRVGKELEAMKTQVDSNTARLDAMGQDTDGDGVADYWDQEEGSPEGAVVNPKGQTVFYKDNDGNLVYQDPSSAYGGAGGKGGVGADGTYNNGGGNGNNSGGNAGGNRGNYNNGGGGNNAGGGGIAGTTGSGAPKYKFDPNSQQGKSIFMRNDGKGGLASPGTFSSVGYLPAIFFPTNDSRVNKEYYPELFEVARVLKQNPNVKIKVVGHADKRNSESFNKNLGMQRARSVANALKTYFGVPESQIIVESRGEMEPLSNASNMGAMAANRRVQFEIEDGSASGSKKASATPKKAEQQLIDPATPEPDDFDQDIKQIINEPIKTESEGDSGQDAGTETGNDSDEIDIFGEPDPETEPDMIQEPVPEPQNEAPVTTPEPKKEPEKKENSGDVDIFSTDEESTDDF